MNGQNTYYRGKKQYELSNHLGNVLVTVSDRKRPVDTLFTYSRSAGTYKFEKGYYTNVSGCDSFNSNTTTAIADFYNADVITAQDYYPFGSPMSGRRFNSMEYRWGFQGQEEDQEMMDGAISFKYRIHDPRIGRFLSVDPLSYKYSFNSNYAFCENRVIDGIELEGLEHASVTHFENSGNACYNYSYESDGTKVMETVETYAQYISNEDLIKIRDNPNSFSISVVYEDIDSEKNDPEIHEVTVTAPEKKKESIIKRLDEEGFSPSPYNEGYTAPELVQFIAGINPLVSLGSVITYFKDGTDAFGTELSLGGGVFNVASLLFSATDIGIAYKTGKGMVALIIKNPNTGDIINIVTNVSFSALTTWASEKEKGK